MKHTSHTPQTPDGLALQLEQWQPDDEAPEFGVAMVHGLSDHIGRFEGVARDVVNAGGFAFGLDLRGQGWSGGQPGHVDGFEEYASDVAFALRHTADAVPETQRPSAIPWFLLGHSMGAIVALIYLLERTEDHVPLRGVVLTNPFLEIKVKVPPLKLFAGRVLNRVLPTMPISQGMDDASAVMRDPEAGKRYLADPRRVRVSTPRWYASLRAAWDRLEEQIGRMPSIPQLWMVGTGDQLVVPERAAPLFARLPEGDFTFKPFEGFGHELHHEPPETRAVFIKAMLEWIASHTQR